MLMLPHPPLVFVDPPTKHRFVDISGESSQLQILRTTGAGGRRDGECESMNEEAKKERAMLNPLQISDVWNLT